MSVSEDQNYVEEWKAARDTIAKLDEHIHDIRKYGFTFITALFTINSFLITLPVIAVTTNSSGTTSLTTTSQSLSPLVKFALLGVTLVLIIGARLLEKTYTLLQESAAMRASVLERRLNFELTETIAYVAFAIGRAWLIGPAPYYAFEVAVLALAVAVLPGPLAILLGALALVEFLYFVRLATRPKQKFVDWTIDRLELQPTDELRIRFHNISRDGLQFKPGELWWELKDMDSSRKITSRTNDHETVVPAFNGYAWSTPLQGIDVGAYQVVGHWQRRIFKKGEWRQESKDQVLILNKKVIVTKSAPKKDKDETSSKSQQSQLPSC